MIFVQKVVKVIIQTSPAVLNQGCDLGMKRRTTMRKLIYLLALLVFLGAVPKAMALDQTPQAIDRAYKDVVAQQKKQKSHWKALETEAARLLNQGQMSAIKLNRK